MQVPVSLALGAGNLRIGSTELHLYEAVSLIYDDNIFLTDGNFNRKVSDTITVFSPGVEIKRDKNNNMMFLNYRADILNYQNNPKESREDHNVRFFSDSRFGGGLLLRFQYDYLDTADPASSELTTIDERTQNTLALTAGAVFKDNMTFKLNFRDTKHDYDKSSRSSLDRNKQLIGSEISFSFLPKTYFFVEYGKTTIEYDTVVNNDIKNSGADSYYLGVRGTLTPKSFLNVRLGYSNKKYDQQGKKGFSGTVIDLSLANEYSEFTRITVSGHRELVESFYLNNNFYVENRINCAFEYVFNHKLSSQFNGFYAVNEYNMSSVDFDGSSKKRADNMTGVGIDIIYNIQPWLSAVIKYTLKERDSNFNAEDYNDNQLIFTVKAEI